MARDMPSAAGRPRGGPRAGFTLFEIILAAAIIVILSGAIILGVGGWYRKQGVDEGARRVEAILRMARAEACSQGRRVRLAFDPTDLTPAIYWEPDPLGQPGLFVRHYGQWANDLPTDVIVFLSCRRTGASAARLLTYSEAEEPVTPDGEPLESLTFLPDGSCDSAVIEVADADGVDLRVGRLEIDGITGAVRLSMLTPTEQAALEEGEGEGEGL